MTSAGWSGDDLHVQIQELIFDTCHNIHWEDLDHNPTSRINHLIGRVLCNEPQIAHFTIYAHGFYKRKNTPYKDMPDAEVAILIYEGTIVIVLEEGFHAPHRECHFGYRMSSRRGTKVIVPDYADRWLNTMEEFEDEVSLNEEEHESKDGTDTRIYEFEEYVPGGVPFQSQGLLRKRGSSEHPLGESQPRRKRSRMVRVPEID